MEKINKNLLKKKKNQYIMILKIGIVPNIERGLMRNYSKQRIEILEELKQMYSHPTAEEVYMEVKAKDNLVSRSTVYRNLNQLVDSNVVKRITTPIGTDRFDYIRDIHNHVVCIKCGKVFDFDYHFNYKRIKSEVNNQVGVEVVNTGITFEGICSECKE